MTEISQAPLNTEQAVRDILGTIEREREREIIARRFGLFERKKHSSKSANCSELPASEYASSKKPY